MVARTKIVMGQIPPMARFKISDCDLIYEGRPVLAPDRQWLALKSATATGIAIAPVVALEAANGSL